MGTEPTSTGDLTDPPAPTPAAPLFSAEVSAGGAGPAVVILHGEVDLSTVAELATALDAAEATDPDTITLDLSDLTFIDSSGLNCLVQVKKRFAGELVLLQPRDNVRRLLAVTGLDKVFRID